MIEKSLDGVYVVSGWLLTSDDFEILERAPRTEGGKKLLLRTRGFL